MWVVWQPKDAYDPDSDCEWKVIPHVCAGYLASRITTVEFNQQTLKDYFERRIVELEKSIKSLRERPVPVPAPRGVLSKIGRWLTSYPFGANDD